MLVQSDHSEACPAAALKLLQEPLLQPNLVLTTFHTLQLPTQCHPSLP
jgi:hypothetical protein